MRLIGTTLWIAGTDLADTIVVDQNQAVLSVTLNGVLTNYNTAFVSGIVVQGLDGNDQLTLGGSVTLSSTIRGGDGADMMTGGGANDLLIGGAGNDVYLFDTDQALGSDTINESGGGTDTLNFGLTTTRGVVVNLSNAAAQVVNANLTLNLSANNTIENVIGGTHGDTLTGNTLDNTLVGGAGDDGLYGGAGNDTFAFNTSTQLNSDTINDGAGVDQLSFIGSSNAVIVSLGLTTLQTVNANLKLTLASATSMEILYGGSGNDTLTGNTLNNTLVGGAGSDGLYGAAGNDTYAFNTNTQLNADTVFDGAGIDQLSFVGSTAAVAVNLGVTTVQTVNANLMLTLNSATSIENLLGGSGNDTLTGNTLDNTLVGGAGSDGLYGAAGNDTFAFNTNTQLNADTVFDGAGTDQLSFVGSTADVVVNLGLTTVQTVNANLMLTLNSATSIENLLGGSGNDTLTGNTLANVLAGGAGNDTLAGGSGKNILIGGTGTDTLTGGSTEDLLLGARYTLETDTTALTALLAEWTSANTYTNRVAHLLGTLAGGANGSFTLTSTTVKEDAAKDTLTGGSGKDWYLRNSTGATVANRDTVNDADVDSVFTEISTWL